MESLLEQQEEVVEQEQELEMDCDGWEEVEQELQKEQEHVQEL